MRLAFNTFGGILPKVALDLLAGVAAQTARNCNLGSGQLKPWDNDLNISDLVNSGTVRTIYYHDGQYWLEWEADVNVVPGPVSADTAGKLYFTGAGIPKKTNTALATTGAGSMPIDFYPLAVAHGIVACTGVAGAGGAGDARNIVYVWTCVTSWGEEGIPSPASAVVSAMNAQTVALSGMALAWASGTAYAVGDFVFEAGDEGGVYIYKCVAGGTSGAVEPAWYRVLDKDTEDAAIRWQCFRNNLSEKRIYRLNTGNSSASFQFVGSIGDNETSLSDTVTDANLGEVLASENYDQPPDGLLGLCYLGNGIMLGFSGKDLYASEPYKPWAWPIGNINSLASTIVSITATGAHPMVPISSGGGSAVIGTERNPYLVTGTDPSALSVVPLPDPDACVSKRGAVGYKGGVIIPVAEGLKLVSSNGATTLITDKHYSWKEWQEIHPETLHSYIHDNKYFGFYSSGDVEGGIVLDLITGELTTLTLYSDAAFVDASTGSLYFLRNEEIPPPPPPEPVLPQEGFVFQDEPGGNVFQEDKEAGNVFSFQDT